MPATTTALQTRKNKASDSVGPLDLNAAIEAARQTYRRLVEQQARGQATDSGDLAAALIAVAKPLDTFRRDAEVLAARLKAAAELGPEADGDSGRLTSLREQDAALEHEQAELQTNYRRATANLGERRQAIEQEKTAIENRNYHRCQNARKVLLQTADPRIAADIQAESQQHSRMQPAALAMKRSPTVSAHIAAGRQAIETKTRDLHALRLDPIAGMGWSH